MGQKNLNNDHKIGKYLDSYLPILTVNDFIYCNSHTDGSRKQNAKTCQCLPLKKDHTKLERNLNPFRKNFEKMTSNFCHPCILSIGKPIFILWKYTTYTRQRYTTVSNVRNKLYQQEFFFKDRCLIILTIIPNINERLLQGLIWLLNLLVKIFLNWETTLYLICLSVLLTCFNIS